MIIQMKIIYILVWVVTAFTFSGPDGTDKQKNVVVNPKDGQHYIWISPGSFQMGCSPDDKHCQDGQIQAFNKEHPSHQVTISKGFWMSRTEVTIGAYRKYALAIRQKTPEELVLSAPKRFRWEGFPQADNFPMAFVTWEDAKQYCEWAGGRLPTEAEWEYAARGGSQQARYGNLDEIAWYADNSGPSKLNSVELWEKASSPQDYGKQLRKNGNDTHPVNMKAPNDFGLHDMLGNVWEHCADWYDENYYQVSEEKDPFGPLSGEFRIMRGGAWNTRPPGVRVSIRGWMLPDHRFNNIGFRCVMDEIPVP